MGQRALLCSVVVRGAFPNAIPLEWTNTRLDVRGLFGARNQDGARVLGKSFCHCDQLFHFGRVVWAQATLRWRHVLLEQIFRDSAVISQSMLPTNPLLNLEACLFNQLGASHCCGSPFISISQKCSVKHSNQ